MHAFQIMLPFGTMDPEQSVTIANNVYKQFAKDVPRKLVNNEYAVPWNGCQINYMHGCKLHNDINDIPNIPAIIMAFGESRNPLRIHHQDAKGNCLDGHYMDVPMKQGGVLLFDSKLMHEVIPMTNQIVLSNDGKGVYSENRYTVVLMANKQFGDYVSSAYVSTVMSGVRKKCEGPKKDNGKF